MKDCHCWFLLLKGQSINAVKIPKDTTCPKDETPVLSLIERRPKDKIVVKQDNKIPRYVAKSSFFEKKKKKQ